jgi:hypothetical protein
MRRDGMLELQEVPENMFFCPTEICHLGTTRCPAENCDKAYDQQFAKVMPCVVGPRVGMSSKAARKMSMRGTGSKRAIPTPESIHPKIARPVGSGQIPNAIPLAGTRRRSFRLAQWVFFGSRRYGFRILAPGSMVKMGTMVKYDYIDDVPDDIIHYRQNAGFDFGKFDYVVVNDRACLLDMNPDPNGRRQWRFA